MSRQISHEREAEELRSGIEKLCDTSSDTILERLRSGDDVDLAVVSVDDLRELLDSVDARDSVKFLEQKERRAKNRKKKGTKS